VVNLFRKNKPMETIKVISWGDVPDNFTGIAEYPNGNKHWFKEGKLHREGGPAVEKVNGKKEWWVDDRWYLFIKIDVLVKTSIYLGKEKGKHNLEWLTFLTPQGIEKFPIIPGMELDKNFKLLFEKLRTNR